MKIKKKISWKSVIRWLRNVDLPLLMQLLRAQIKDWWRICTEHKTQVIVATLVLVGGLVLIFAVDWSADLTTAELAQLQHFVIRTNATPVRDAFDTAQIHGPITLHKEEVIIDIAKAQRPGYGLISAEK